MSDINLDNLIGLVTLVYCVGLALFFLLAALISYLALRRTRDRDRWRPRIGVSLLFALGALIALAFPHSKAQFARLDASAETWVTAVLTCWLTVLVVQTWRAHARARRPPAI